MTYLLFALKKSTFYILLNHISNCFKNELNNKLKTQVQFETLQQNITMPANTIKSFDISLTVPDGYNIEAVMPYSSNPFYNFNRFH